MNASVATVGFELGVAVGSALNAGLDDWSAYLKEGKPFGNGYPINELPDPPTVTRNVPCE